MLFDWHDYGDDLPGRAFRTRLRELRALRPDFRCSVLAIPARGDTRFWNSTPDWIELVLHGYAHLDSYECSTWSAQRMKRAIDEKPARFVEGFGAPGWQISDGCYEALLEADWFVADHPETRARRPAGLRVHELNVGPEHWHGHVTGEGVDNGIEETWEKVVALVESAPSFEFMSEVVQPWQP